MARTPEIDLEYVTAGDPYSIVVKFTGEAADFDVAAMARARAGATGDPLATFDVDATDGTGDDEGRVVAVLTLDGETTATLPAVVWCDVQRTADGEDEPVTLLRWPLAVEGDVTR